MKKSDKNFGVAVSLSAIFGVLGIHFFYLGKILHGLFDLGLSVGGFIFIALGQPVVGGLMLLLDILHTFYTTICLFLGKQTDGKNKLVCYPGQTIS